MSLQYMSGLLKEALDERGGLVKGVPLGYLALNRIWIVSREPLVSKKLKNLGQGKPDMQATV